MNETHGPAEPHPWVPDDQTPHTYAVPAPGAHAPEPASPPAYGYPLPSLTRRRRADSDAAPGGLRVWLRRTFGRGSAAFDAADDHG
ncbi:hypothetical protein [Terrabacter sp. 2RAF25]|uniref:hypothetical protein n=1 Tax=Terrabacter sp. 2RAF25 TaxID=3232998 RepID=UPI003F9D1580